MSSSLFNPLALELLIDDVLPSGSSAAQPSGAAPVDPVGGDSLVNKDVWDMLADEAFDPSHPLEGADRGSGKRDRRTASISSACSDDMPQRQSFNLSPEDLAGAIDSMDLANLYDGSRTTGLHSKPGKASLNSEDMNRLLQGGIGLSQPLSSGTLPFGAGPTFSGASFSGAGLGMPSCAESDEGGASSWPADGGEDAARSRRRSSSDQSRPLWRAILMSIDDLSASLAAEGGGIGQKQAAISDFHQTMVRATTPAPPASLDAPPGVPGLPTPPFDAPSHPEPPPPDPPPRLASPRLVCVQVPKLSALGEVGVLLRARLAMLMSDTGLIEGTAQPESEAALTNTAMQALASLRRYAGNAMVAPIVMPRGSCGNESDSASAARKRQLSLGSSDMAGLCGSALAQQQIPLGAPSLPAGEDGPKLHACKNCQRAKTACMDQRPCPRCLRLGIPCDNDAKSVKRACANCKRAKVKCDLDAMEPCGRCRRLGLVCQVHVPNKKKRGSGDDDESPRDSAASPRVTGGSAAGGSSFEPLSPFAGFGPVPAAGGFGPSGAPFGFGDAGAPAPLSLGGGMLDGGLGSMQPAPGGGLSSLDAMPSAAALTDAFGAASGVGGAPTSELDSLGTLGRLVEAQQQQPYGQEEVPETLGNLDDVCEQLLRSSTNSNPMSLESPRGGMGSMMASASGLPAMLDSIPDVAVEPVPTDGIMGEAPGVRLTQLLPCPPLLPVANVLSPGEWSLEMRDGNARLLKRATVDMRVLWATVTDVPAPPALVAAGLRQVLREWGSRDPLVPSVRVLSEGAEPPAWMAECGGASEQLLHAGVALPGGGGRDFALRSVWALSEGAHACSMRPASSAAVPEVAGVQRGAVAADIWVLANPEEPGGAVLHAVLEPADNAPLMADGDGGGGGGGGGGAKQMLEWTRRVQEAAIMLQRDSTAAGAAAPQ